MGLFDAYMLRVCCRDEGLAIMMDLGLAWDEAVLRVLGDHYPDRSMKNFDLVESWRYLTPKLLKVPYTAGTSSLAGSLFWHLQLGPF